MCYRRMFREFKTKIGVEMNNNPTCKSRTSEYRSMMYQKHKEKRKKETRDHYKKNKKEIKRKSRIWRKENQEYMREYRKKHRKQYKEYSKKHLKNHPYNTKIAKKYSEKYSYNIKVRSETYRKYGKAKKCCICNSIKRPQHHHYTEPYEIDRFVDLCRKCHGILDRKGFDVERLQLQHKVWLEVSKREKRFKGEKKNRC